MDKSKHALAAARLLRAMNVPATSLVTVLYVVEPPDDRVLHLLTTTAPKFREAAQVLIRVTKERGRQVLERVRKVVTHRGLTG